LTIQKRTYRTVQTRIGWGFQRPTSAHFTMIGTTHAPRKATPANATVRR
jgi:hypothetical protein